MSKPKMRTLPALGARKPESIFRVVDLPAPLGPRRPTISPRSMRKLKSFTTVRPEKRLLSLSMSIMVSLEVEPFAVMRRGSHERGRLPGVIGWFSSGLFLRLVTYIVGKLPTNSLKDGSYRDFQGSPVAGAAPWFRCGNAAMSRSLVPMLGTRRFPLRSFTRKAVAVSIDGKRNSPAAWIFELRDQCKLEEDPTSASSGYSSPFSSGRRISKVVPWPTWLWQPILPPCRSITVLTMASPRPRPALPSAEAKRWYWLNRRGSSAAAIPCPGRRSGSSASRLRGGCSG